MPRRQQHEKTAEPRVADVVGGVMRVKTESDPHKIAGAIAGQIRENRRSEVQAIGAGALNQAVKAIAIARGYLASSGLDVWCCPAFVNVVIDGKEYTAIKLCVEPHDPTMR